MRNGHVRIHNTKIQYSFLEYGEDNWMHLTYSIVPEQQEPVAEQIRTIEKAELEFCRTHGIEADMVMFKRFFSSSDKRELVTLIGSSDSANPILENKLNTNAELHNIFKLGENFM